MGSLRYCINQANMAQGPHTITVDDTVKVDGIQLETALPALQ
jgi:hypothetical protein